MNGLYLGVVAVISILSPYFALAESGWTGFAKEAELIPTSCNYSEVRNLVSENPSGCNEQYWFYQDYDSHGADMMYQALPEGIGYATRLRVYVTGKCNINGYSEFSALSSAP